MALTEKRCENVLWMLMELESTDDIESDEIEIYGEDIHGNEGSSTIKINKIAKDARLLAIELKAERDTFQRLYRETIERLLHTEAALKKK